MSSTKEKIINEFDKIPQDKIEELYDIIHFFRIGIKKEQKPAKDKQHMALNFFGIWKDMLPEEATVLDDIKSRRKSTLRKRML